MTINSKFSRKIEEEKATKKALLKVLEKLHKDCIVHCRYLPNKDQFFVICYIDTHDDDAYFTMKFDYEEVIEWICDETAINHFPYGTID